jgi:hypothetical protein
MTLSKEEEKPKSYFILYKQRAPVPIPNRTNEFNFFIIIRRSFRKMTQYYIKIIILFGHLPLF